MKVFVFCLLSFFSYTENVLMGTSTEKVHPEGSSGLDMKDSDIKEDVRQKRAPRKSASECLTETAAKSDVAVNAKLQQAKKLDKLSGFRKSNSMRHVIMILLWNRTKCSNAIPTLTSS